MDFDLISMKLRAKQLMSHTEPSPWIVGVILGVIAFAFVLGFYFMMYVLSPDSNSNVWILYVIAMELVYLNFRASAHWYCLEVAREGKTSVSDAFLAFKKRPVKVWLAGVLKDICLFVGFCMCLVGFVFPFYWFRFATYVIYDDETLSVFGALGKSMKLLKGHYMELVKLDISNLGWFALAYFTSGAACFYVKPYTTLVYAEFYDYLKGQAELFEH